jgi:nucleoside-diphosphate-sugar epimerase
MRNVLITGGGGFIGSYLVKNFLKTGYQPIIYDAFIHYVSPLESKYQQFLSLRFKDIKDQIIIERGDTRDKFNLEKTIKNYRPEIIVHLAALPIADLSFKYTEEAVGSILQGTINILDIIKDVDFVERFVYTSSSMVYGDFVKCPAEEDQMKKPKDIYGGTKLSGEIMVETYARRYGIKYSIIRPSAVYGPTDVNRRVSQIFMESAISGKELLLHGGGQNMLDFSFVEDTADGFFLAATEKNGENEVFNITCGEGRSLLEFVEILKNYIPELSYKNVEQQVFRPKRGSLDISKAKKLLGYSPKYNLEDGIKKYYDFYLMNPLGE